MKFFFLSLAIFLSSFSAFALDYEAEYKLIESVEALRNQTIDQDTVLEKTISYVTEYQALLPRARQQDRMMYAIDEFYHERLEEILKSGLVELKGVSLDRGTPEDIKKYALWLIKSARLGSEQ